MFQTVIVVLSFANNVIKLCYILYVIKLKIECGCALRFFCSISWIFATGWRSGKNTRTQWVRVRVLLCHPNSLRVWVRVRVGVSGAGLGGAKTAPDPTPCP